MDRRAALTALAAALTGCGGGGGSNDTPATAAAAPLPTPAPTAAPTPASAPPATPAPTTAPTPAPTPTPAPPPPASIALWGDSLTVDYGASLAALLPARTVFVGGVGGQTSTQAAARQGGVVPLMHPAGDTIPASGPAQIVSQDVTMQTNPGPGDVTGSLAGVHGTMKLNTSTGIYTFTRDTAGAAVATNAAGEPFTVDTFGRRSWPAVFWYGRNNFGSPAQVLADIAASVAFLAPGTDYLVLAITNQSVEPIGSGSYVNILNLNAAIAAAHPGHYFDMRAYLVSQFDASQAQDVNDHANDVPPTSLRRDALHMNAAGQTVLAAKVKALIDARGW